MPKLYAGSGGVSLVAVGQESLTLVSARTPSRSRCPRRRTEQPAPVLRCHCTGGRCFQHVGSLEFNTRNAGVPVIPNNESLDIAPVLHTGQLFPYRLFDLSASSRGSIAMD